MRQWINISVLLSIFACGPAATAQTKSLPDPLLIGVLTRAYGNVPISNGISHGLTELGYQEYRDFVIGTRFTSGDSALLPKVADELIAAGAHLLVGVGNAASNALAKATLPILFSAITDPVGLGLIESYARPGGQSARNGKRRNRSGSATIEALYRDGTRDGCRTDSLPQAN